jgi:ribosomal protein L17
MKLKIPILIICLILLANCGFKLTDLQSNYYITEINSSGDKRINYKLKTKLLSSSKEKSKNVLLLNINSQKEKIIKEKNISNEITKYEIIVTTKIEYKKLSDNKFNKFTVVKKGDYNIASKYSDTLNNEKSLVNTLIENLSEEIFENLSIKFNDL